MNKKKKEIIRLQKVILRHSKLRPNLKLLEFSFTKHQLFQLND